MYSFFLLYLVLRLTIENVIQKTKLENKYAKNKSALSILRFFLLISVTVATMGFYWFNVCKQICKQNFVIGYEFVIGIVLYLYRN